LVLLRHNTKNSSRSPGNPAGVPADFDVIGLKGRNNPAQGNALGSNSKIKPSPVRAKRGLSVVVLFQGKFDATGRIPRALPWLICIVPSGHLLRGYRHRWLRPKAAPGLIRVPSAAKVSFVMARPSDCCLSRREMFRPRSISWQLVSTSCPSL
jgi:hypothetical protein